VVFGVVYPVCLDGGQNFTPASTRWASDFASRLLYLRKSASSADEFFDPQMTQIEDKTRRINISMMWTYIHDKANRDAS
jgi:hypothetical protein